MLLLLPLYEVIAIAMFAGFLLLLATGYPVAWVLSGISALTAFASIFVFGDALSSTFYSVSLQQLSVIVQRFWSIMSNWLLVAMPMFIFMGIMLEKSGLASNLVESFARVLGRMPAGYALTVTAIGILLGATTGIIGASVVLLALLGMPVMMKNGYSAALSSGVVCATGALGILIPPSIMLVVMADRTPGVDAGSLFSGALIPGIMLGVFYLIYEMVLALVRPDMAPPAKDRGPLRLADLWALAVAIFPPALLILAVLGSIFAGIATPTEAAGLGAMGATLLALMRGRLDRQTITEICEETTRTTAFIFAIFLGATAFSFIFQSLGGEELVVTTLKGLPFGDNGILISILLVIFVLGFFLEWLEITLLVLPFVSLVVPTLDVGPADSSYQMVWFVMLVAVCLQTSFLTPPVGFALFYLKGVAPAGVRTVDIYRGVIPFIAIQLFALALVYIFPKLATWLPELAYG